MSISKSGMALVVIMMVILMVYLCICLVRPEKPRETARYSWDEEAVVQEGDEE